MHIRTHTHQLTLTHKTTHVHVCVYIQFTLTRHADRRFNVNVRTYTQKYNQFKLTCHGDRRLTAYICDVYLYVCGQDRMHTYIQKYMMNSNSLVTLTGD